MTTMQLGRLAVTNHADTSSSKLGFETMPFLDEAHWQALRPYKSWYLRASVHATNHFISFRSVPLHFISHI